MANGRIPDLTNYTTPDGTNDTVPIWDIANSQTKKITRNNYLGITGNPVGHTDSQTLSNKTLGNTNTVTLKGTLFTLQDDSDTTKQARFIMSGITTATTRSYTLPNASGTLVDLNTTQTLTNKTLTSPVITGGSMANTTVTVDAVSGYTSANTGTIYGISVTSSKISGASLTNSTVGPNQLGTGAATNVVATNETTTSTSYVALATASAVTVTIGVNGLALVIIGADLKNSGANYSLMGYAISGATTKAASDTTAFGIVNTNDSIASRVNLETGLAAGSTTFTTQFKAIANTLTAQNRSIVVIPL